MCQCKRGIEKFVRRVDRANQADVGRVGRVEDVGGVHEVERGVESDDPRQEPGGGCFGRDPEAAEDKPESCCCGASRASVDKVRVAPMPTAGPLTAAITGLRQSNTARVTRPPVSRTRGQ